MNPFTERSRITDPTRFTGRWREVGMVFERLEQRRPVLVTGAPGMGKSSLLTHVAQSAGAVLELPDLEALFLDLAVLPDAATAYKLITRALGSRGDTAAAVETALVDLGRPTLIAFDRADAALAAGWGEDLLERLARVARRSVPRHPDRVARLVDGSHDLMLVAASTTAPALSEPFATVRLGGLAAAEIRLLTEAYLDEGEVVFTAEELRALGVLSGGHPAYVQRAAYHLYQAHTQAGYDWRAAYLAEAREQPVPGAPLPPEVFRGEGEVPREEARYGELATEEARRSATPTQTFDIRSLLEATLPFVVALVTYSLSGNWLVALGVLVVGYTVVAFLRRQGY